MIDIFIFPYLLLTVSQVINKKVANLMSDELKYFPSVFMLHKTENGAATNLFAIDMLSLFEEHDHSVLGT